MVIILKHVPSEGAGTLEDFLKANGIPFQEVCLYEGEKLPSEFQSIHSVLIMGGPMNVYEEDKYPFLKEENDFIKKLIENKIPTLGICLGAQLIAKALGCKVYKAAKPEIGWSYVELTQESKKDTLFSVIPGEKLKVLQWHEDTFDISKGATHLAKNAQVPNQAFCFAAQIYGLQFHIEVNREILKDWFKSHSDLNLILSEYKSYSPDLKKITDSFYERFFGLGV